MKKSSLPIIDINKYGGKQVAVVNGKIVASGTRTQDVLEAAQRKIPGTTWRDILLISVPKSLHVVYTA
jgi:hypothetical protein